MCMVTMPPGRQSGKQQPKWWRKLPGAKRITVGGDKGYDTKDFVEAHAGPQRHAPRGPERYEPGIGH